MLVTFCSLLVTFSSLLVSLCLLFVTFCSLLVTFCSLLVTFCSLLVTFCSLLVIFSSKLLWTAKKEFDYKETPPQIFSLEISETLVTFSRCWFSKFSQHTKLFIFKVEIKSNIVWIDITLKSLLQHLDTFLCTWRVRSRHLEEFYKKSVLKYSTKFTEKHLRWSLFCNKAAGWRPITSLNTESRTGAFQWIFWNLYKNIYIAKVCKVTPLLEFLSVKF